MLYYLHEWSERLGFLNVFQYITFRAFAAAITAFLICLACGKWLIFRLVSLKFGQPIRSQGDLNTLYERHSRKAGTPTMGGLLIIFAVVVAGVLWARPTNPYVWLALGSIVGLGALGFADDYIKVRSRRNRTAQDNKGVSGVTKLAVQFVLAAIVTGFFLYGKNPHPLAQAIFIPTVKAPLVQNVGLSILIFYALVIMGTSNAVNVTDGLDGLAVGCTVSTATVFAIFSYIVGDAKLSDYLLIPHFPGASELTVLCMALAGAGLGFLWFNAHPAQVFMGDTGSLAIGGFLAVVAICCKQEILIIIAGGVFFMEILSVLIQVVGFKLTGRRIFPMTPLHHSFEKRGWSETQIVIRFWILSIVCAVLAVATLKVR